MVGRTLSHYRITARIGAGGMGVVYRAEDLTLGRTVALKFLLPELTADPAAKARFAREARAAACLDHPNVCPVYETGEADGQLFIVMPFVEGETLRDRIARGPLPIADTVGIAREVAEGLKAAHARGIVHRDIKPANIMLGSGGQARILDFGLARQDSPAELTRTRSMVLAGTVSYMSPEQVRGESVDGRTDIWALGCVIHEMVTGRVAFDADSVVAVLRNIADGAPPPVRSLRPDIPVALAQIVDRCLQREPHARYAGASEVAGALAAVDAAAPIRRGASIAVLPLVDMSSAKDQEYFCDGIAEELINALAHVSGLRVVARTSAFAFKGQNLDVREIGRRLDVSHVLEGSLRKAGDRLRITAQLIDVADGCHLWSERFDRGISDIFQVQDEVSHAVVENLRVTLLAGEKAVIEKRHTRDADAYNLYLKGVHFGWKTNVADCERAIAYFTEAFGRDPLFAPAYAGVSRVYAMMATLSFVSPAEAWARGARMLRRALEIDPELADAHAQLAGKALFHDWDWDVAERGFRHALAINPGLAHAHAWYAWLHICRGRFDEAEVEISRAQALDPLMPAFYAMHVGIDWMSGRFDDALAEFERAKEIDPAPGLAHFHAGVACFHSGRLDQAEALFRLPMPPGSFSGWGEAYLGRIALTRGHAEEARRAAEQLIEKRRTSHVSPFSIALLLLTLGDADRAARFFDAAFEERDPLMPFLNTMVLKGFIAPDPTLDAVLGRLKAGAHP